VDEAGLSSLHVFPYSPRPGTPAARLPRLPGEIVRERAARLRQKGEAALAARLDAMAGSVQTVLTERGGIGRTPCFTPVLLEGTHAPGTLRGVTITGRQGERLTGALQ